MNAYDFHHSIDFLILRATAKILSKKSLDKSKYYFYSDFSNDSGIINLLRKTYLEEGDFEKAFNQYQNSRLEPKSYRYESLIATLIIVIVGNIISGILLDVYSTNKEKIIKLFDEKILSSIKMIPEKIQNMFIKGKEDYTKKDLKNLLNCYIARFMLEKQLIDLESYYDLVAHFMHENEIDTNLLQVFDQFMEKYLLEKDSINVDSLYNVIEAYSRGTFLKYLDEENCNIPYFENIAESNIISGTPASAGICRGKIVKIIDGIDNKKLLKKFRYSHSYKKILCASQNFLLGPPIHNKIFEACDAVVTWHTSAGGHLPLICRWTKKPCVIIDESEESLLIDNDDIVISGNEGLVYIGLIARENDK